MGASGVRAAPRGAHVMWTRSNRRRLTRRRPSQGIAHPIFRHRLSGTGAGFSRIITYYCGRKWMSVTGHI